jgi:hypothetical protein
MLAFFKGLSVKEHGVAQTLPSFGKNLKVTPLRFSREKISAHMT